LVCVGNPDTGVVCSCRNLWDCDKNKDKCSQAIIPPDGSGGWNCTEWNEFQGVTCEKPGTAADVPDGGGAFTCQFNAELMKVVCKENQPSSPSGPGGAGDWKCTITDSEGPQKLVCEAENPSGTPEPTPTGGGVWDCNADKTQCKKTDENGGLPPGGSGDWKCHEETVAGEKYIVCVGTSQDAPGGGSWVCQSLPSSEFNDWICKRPKEAGDTPPGGGTWACKAGSEFGGIVCTKTDIPVTPPTPFPQPGDICVPGTQRWCDGLAFCGWGMITCLPDGTWPTTMKNGKVMLKCEERADGKRPNTPCACYHFYFNPKCCERPDCILDAGTDGQICPTSAGNTCDYCNPQKPNCKNGICAVSNSMETFCTEHCGANKACPQGMICMAVKNAGQIANECIPADFSCYNGI
jgi:hypothetical protein